MQEKNKGWNIVKQDERYVVLIEDGEFHRVHNSGQEILEFVCVFDGKREH